MTVQEKKSEAARITSGLITHIKKKLAGQPVKDASIMVYVQVAKNHDVYNETIDAVMQLPESQEKTEALRLLQESKDTPVVYTPPPFVPRESGGKGNGKWWLLGAAVLAFIFWKSNKRGKSD